MDTVLRDLKYGLRMLAKNPGFTLIVLATLALGIGANTAIFSVVHTVLLKQFPYESPEQLYLIWEDASHYGFAKNTPAPANFVDWQKQSKSFEQMAAIYTEEFKLTGDGEPELVGGAYASANLFSMLGAKPERGRAFVAGEDDAGTPRVVVLSQRLWQRRFGGDPNTVGRKILVDGKPHTVVGIMAAGFQFPTPEFDLWTPFAWTDEDRTDRDNHFLYVLGRLRGGVAPETARAEMQTIAQRLERDYPKTNQKLGASIEPLRELFSGDVRPALLALLAAVGLVLLIACANVANLLLARATGRQRELAVRAALGAGRRHLLSLVLTESVLLGVIGGVLGLFLAWFSVDSLETLLPLSIAGAGGIKLSLPVLAFTLLVSLLTGIVFGIAPAWQALRFDLNTALKEGGRGVVHGQGRLRGALIVAEVALSLCLLVAAGLMTRTLAQMLNAPLGFEPDNVLTLRTTLSGEKFRPLPARTAFFRDVLERVRALPGAVAAGYTSQLPLTFTGDNVGYSVEGRPAPEPGHENIASIRVVTPGYFRAMGIPMQKGREFDERDHADAERVVIIAEVLARKFWPQEEALGKRLRRGSAANPNPTWLTVVGIIRDVPQGRVDEAIREGIYLPQAQFAGYYFVPKDLVVRAAGDPLLLANAVREAVRATDKDQPIAGVTTMQQVVRRTLAQRELQSYLFGGFAGIALLLAVVGIYGVLAQLVAQREQEFGIRMALGAQAGDVLRLVIGHGLRLVGAGVAIGLVAALGLTRFLAGLLYGVSATDPATFAIVPLVLAAAALAACYLPARRATRVDPMVALRYE